MEHNLDAHCQMILDEYLDNLDTYQKIQEIVIDKLNECIRQSNITINAVEARIKTEKSLRGKLMLKGYKYNSIADITDIVGARVITFYTDEVDKVAAIIDKVFDIDWQNSIDKRTVLELDQFGYMSLHYICRIPQSLYDDPAMPKVNQYRFEIQMRTALQHVWATMYHDTGYKSGIEIPREHLRNMNRIAGMLELADEQFSRIRKEITDYRRKIQSLVADGDFDSIPLNGDTFRSFLDLNPYQKLIDKIANINQAEVYEDNIFRFLDIFLKMGFKTLGDLVRMNRECKDGAYQLALHQLAGTDLDIVALSIAIQNLCVIHIVKNYGGEKELKHFYDCVHGPSNYNQQRAARTFKQIQEINLK